MQTQRVKFQPGQTLPLRGQQQPQHNRNQTDDSSLGSFAAAANTNSSNGANANESTEHDADIDEFSDAGLTTQDDGGESTEPEHMEKTMYFGQAVEKPR